jgi:hypothetical protein
MESYEKCYPGKISAVSIKDKNITTTFKNNKIALQSIDDNKYLILNDNNYQIVYDNSDYDFKEVNQIGMPWVQGLKITLNKAIMIPL